MSASLARLRKRAAEFEQKKQFDRALEVYVQILDEGGKDLDDEDVPLFNRVGDMLMRKGSVTEALGYYERAVDVYAERGYLNNAIALCSKILRQSPGRAAVYYKLARISARKGFKSDARKNFLEYADRMQKLGMADEAFRALKEFASLYPDQDDVRLVLAELLSKENRKGEALEQLQSLYEKLQSEGRSAEARATVDRMRAIDPTVTPREGTATQTPSAGDLVFLDLNDAEPSRPTTPRPGDATSSQPASARAPLPTPVPALTGLSITFFPSENEADAPHPEGFESTAVESEPVDVPPVSRSLTPLGAELVVEPAPSTPPPVEAVEPVETLDLIEDAAPAPLERIENLIEELVPETPPPGVGRPTPSSITPLSSHAFADIELDDVPPEMVSREHDLTLPGELPAGPEETPAPPLPSLDSAAAAEDARAAAEEAADLAADMVAREAAQAVKPAGWQPPSYSTPDRDAPDEASDVADVPDEAAHDLELTLTAEVHDAGIPDDFMAMPPSFGSVGGTPTEHAFPPLPGLDDDTEPLESSADADVEANVEAGIVVPTPRATISIGSAESHLRSRLELDPENYDLRRQLGEALLDTGDRDGGLYELELAMVGYELRGDLDRAQEVVDEILGVSPGSVAHHQKRVEYAVKSRDRQRLTHSYLELADALFRNGAADKAVAVYSRVLELDTSNERAEFALATLAPEDLARLRGGPKRPERWTDELAAIRGEPKPVAVPQPAMNAPVPDESPASEDEAPVESEAPPSPRVRFDSIELPVPDWGEGVPIRAEKQAPRAPQAHEPVDEAGRESTPAEALDAQPGERDAIDEAGILEEAAVGHSDGSGDSEGDPRVPTPLSVPEQPPTPVSIPSQTPTPLSVAARTETPSTVPTQRRPTPRTGAATRQPTPRDYRFTPVPTPTPRGPTPTPVPAFQSESPLAGGDSDYIDLGEWLRNTEPARSTRMQVEDPKPTGNEQADFEEMLRRFKRGVAENMEAEDYEAHYDLGVAYKEMGLIDEAIAQFQKALRDPNQRVRSYEALGQCFVEKEQYPIAAALLKRATEVPGSDDQQLVGVLFLLGFALEQMGRPAEGLPYYLRVFAVDIEFRDVADRVAALGNATK